MKREKEKAGMEFSSVSLKCGKLLDIASCHKKIVASVVLLLIGIPVVMSFCSSGDAGLVSLGDEDIMKFASSPVAMSSSAKKGMIVIPSGTVKANPFVPYRNIGDTTVVPDVPVYNLVEPPEMINENSDAARVMDTIVSGILYDKYSPSAILNIEGTDYLVKKGDVVNNYKVLNIVKDSVTVKLGSNVYKAGIGEILTEGSLNQNDVSNLNNKFGGVRR